MPIINNLTVDVERRSVLKRLGLKYPQEVNSQHLDSLIDSEIENARRLIEPKGIYEKFAIINDGSGIIRMVGGFTIISKKLAAWLGGSRGVFLMAVTIGSKVEEEAARLIYEGEPTRGLIADAIGSVAVEELAETVEKLISREAGSSAKRRFSCGYSDWALTDQEKILDLLGAGRIGLSVNDRCIMIPQKSITAAIGFF
ncbi:MAG: hypothetical protein AB1756_00015 [Acidobacteriota bacterium]